MHGHIEHCGYSPQKQSNMHTLECGLTVEHLLPNINRSLFAFVTNIKNRSYLGVDVLGVWSWQPVTNFLGL